MDNEKLPQVEGRRCLMSLADMERRGRLLIREEQEKANPDNMLIDFICNAVRLGREQVDNVKNGFK